MNERSNLSNKNQSKLQGKDKSPNSKKQALENTSIPKGMSIGTTISGMTVANYNNTSDEQEPIFNIPPEDPDLFTTPKVNNVKENDREQSVPEIDKVKLTDSENSYETIGLEQEPQIDPSIYGIDASLDGEETVQSMLYQARLAAGFSISDIAGQLKISQRHIQNLENGDFNLLPNRAFAIGYVRTLAKYLRLDDEFVVNKLKLQWEDPAQDKVVHEFPQTINQRRTPSFGLALLAIIIVVGGYYSWLNLSKPMIDEEIPPTDLATIFEGDKPLINEPIVEETPPPAEVVPLEENVKSPAIDEVTPKPETIAPNMAIPHLVSTKSSWVKLTDKAGDTVFIGIFNPGQKIEIAEGYRISYSDGSALEIDWDGKSTLQLQEAIGATANSRLIDDILMQNANRN